MKKSLKVLRRGYIPVEVRAAFTQEGYELERVAGQRFMARRGTKYFPVWFQSRNIRSYSSYQVGSKDYDAIKEFLDYYGEFILVNINPGNPKMIDSRWVRNYNYFKAYDRRSSLGISVLRQNIRRW